MSCGGRCFKLLSEDFSRFCVYFVNRKSIGYGTFQLLWKELSFDRLFAGHGDEKECREFGKDLLRVAADYFNPCYFTIVRVLGLYLCYAIYHTYPHDLKVPIRITLEEWKDLVNFIKDIKNQILSGTSNIISGQDQELYDIVHIFEMMREERCFSVAITRTEIRPVSQHMVQQDIEDEKIDELFKPCVINKIFNTDTVDDISSVVGEYELQKKKLMELYPDVAKSLEISSGDIIKNITKLLTNHENWKKRLRSNERAETAVDTESDAEKRPGDEENVARRRKELKSKALKMTPTHNDVHRRKRRKAGSKSELEVIKKQELPKEAEGSKKKMRRPMKKRWTAMHSLSMFKTSDEKKELDDNADNEGGHAETLAQLEGLLSRKHITKKSKKGSCLWQSLCITLTYPSVHSFIHDR